MSDIEDKATTIQSAEIIPAPETVYPQDSTELQLQSIDGLLDVTTQSLEDFAKPEMVAILLERHRITLIDLKGAKTKIAELEMTVERQNGESRKLEIDLARSSERSSNMWLEIPLSILSGFAINLLTTEHPPTYAWVTLAVCVVILIYIRIPTIISFKNKISAKDNHGTEEN